MPILFTPPPAPVWSPWTPGTVLWNPWARLGGLNLNVVDANGSAWILERLDGWDGPASSTSATQRSGAHGVWQTKGFLGGRPLALTGWCETGAAEILRDAEGVLNAATDLDDFTFMVDEYGLQRFVTARRTDQVVWEKQNPTTAKWSVELLAGDPMRYGVTELDATLQLPAASGGLVIPTAVPFAINATTTKSTVDVVNDGNIDALPTILIAGPVSLPVVQNLTTGVEMRFQITLSVGEILTIDCRREQVTLDGQGRMATLLGADFLTFQPGKSTIRFAAATSDPAAYCKLTWRPTWR